LPDETTTHLSNPHIPKTIGIAKSFLDKLVSCHVVYPNGATYEAFPTNNLLHDEITFESAVEPFNSCGIGFRNAPPTLSGTYELISVVDHSADNSRSMTRQKFHLTFYYSDTWTIRSTDHYTFLTNQLIGKTMTIPKSFLDTLESCHVIFPNGVVYEAYPKDNTPHDTVFFLTAAQPFTSCAIGFRGAPTTLSGTYELMSLVNHRADSSQSLTRQRFHLTLVEIDPWNGEANN
ncbi:Uncharacterized protein OBRU01_20501, partial [Operophtera brumata]